MVSASISAVGAVTGQSGASQLAGNTASGQDDSEFSQLLGGMGIDTADAAPTGVKSTKAALQMDTALDDAKDLAAAMLALCGVPVAVPIEPAAPAFIPAFIAADATDTVAQPAAGLTSSVSTVVTDAVATATPGADVVQSVVTPPTSVSNVATVAGTNAAPNQTGSSKANNAVATAQSAQAADRVAAAEPAATHSNPAGNVTTQDMQWLRSANQSMGDGANGTKPNADTRSGSAKYLTLAGMAASRIDAAASQTDSVDVPATAPTGFQQVLATAAPMVSVSAGQRVEKEIDITGGEASGVKVDAAAINAQTPQVSAVPHTADSLAVDNASRHQLHSPVGSHQWANELGDKLTMLTAKGSHSATLHMSPADLGPVQVRIELNKDQASVWFTAEHAETRSALEQSLPRLREMFTAQGMSLTDAGVFGDRSRQQANYQRPASDPGIRFGNEESTPDTSLVRSISLSMLDAYA